ncbi:unnamed protein product [Phytomonas sp. EM1]|nr:unnamed protein product [Phytomonas sp. EM1]|eukprot:CCW63096.1 unnamed protein product [Phytomonas sp. isolate EM1]
MWCRTWRLLLKIQYPQQVKGTIARDLPSSSSSVSRRKRQFTNTNRTPASTNSSFTKNAQHSGISNSANGGGDSRFTPSAARVRGHGGGLTRELKPGEPIPQNLSSSSQGSKTGSSSSQRARYRAFQEQQQSTKEFEACRDGTTASLLTPFPRKYAFYDGIDEHGVEPVKPTREMRRKMMQEALESQAVSVVEFTEGGEADIDLNGLPEAEYHGRSGWTTIPKDSALFNSVYAREELESRQRTNSWRVARLRAASTTPTGPLQSANDTTTASAEEAPPEVLDADRRRRHHDEGGYSHQIEGELLEPMLESIGHPRSVYGLRKMYVNGLMGYQGIISRAEEAAICDELLQLLQHPKAAYIAEESRYCVNLYEPGDLGLPGKDTLAFAFSRAPTLQRVLYRFFFLGLIPSPPNVCQISEMIGNFSGYPVHRKPASIGAYFGLLNLISTTVVHLQHHDCPWYPRLHVNPRSLFVVTEPCLGEYGVGYKRTHEPFHTFEYAMRVSKDYRIEVLFATVETSHNQLLRESIALTEYAQKQLTDGAAATQTGVEETGAYPNGTSTSMDPWLQKLRDQLHAREVMSSMGLSSQEASHRGIEATPGVFLPRANDGLDMGVKTVIVDGHALRREMEAKLLIGQTPRTFRIHEEEPSSADAPAGLVSPKEGKKAGISSPARRRLDALKTRHEFAKLLKSQIPASRSNDGPTLIRGHSPRDGKNF